MKYHNDADERGRYYHFTDDDRHYLSVTNAISAKAKPALVGWAAKITAERAMDRLGTWQAIEMEKGEEEARKWISRAARDFNTYRMEFGTAVHWVCEHQDEEVMPELEDIALRLDAMEGSNVIDNRASLLAHLSQYHRFLEEYDPLFYEQEKVVANIEDGWAGRFDMLVGIDGKVYIGDIKSGGAYGDTAMQLAAYRKATHTPDESGRLVEWSVVTDGGFVLELKEDKFRVHWYKCGEGEYQAFLACKTLKEWGDSGKVKGDEWR